MIGDANLTVLHLKIIFKTSYIYCHSVTIFVKGNFTKWFWKLYSLITHVTKSNFTQFFFNSLKFVVFCVKIWILMRYGFLFLFIAHLISLCMPGIDNVLLSLHQIIYLRAWFLFHYWIIDNTTRNCAYFIRAKRLPLIWTGFYKSLWCSNPNSNVRVLKNNVINRNKRHNENFKNI